MKRYNSLKESDKIEDFKKQAYRWLGRKAGNLEQEIDDLVDARDGIGLVELLQLDGQKIVEKCGSDNNIKVFQFIIKELSHSQGWATYTR
jgi:hypothetical protein